MSIKVTPLEQVEPRARDVAIGTFDGVHLGHRAVIEGNDTVLTFEPHPLEVLRPEQAPKLINSLEVKRDVLEGLGVEEMVVIRFDEEFSHRSAEEFIDNALIGKLGARRVAIGENFHFGAKARGTPEMLAAHPSSRRGSSRWSRSTASRSPHRGSGPRSRQGTWRARGAASASPT
jgi:riboflavin kinase/FMN adenylyltransferase